MPPCTLVTIPFSHFCEKARWALDRAGVEYRESGHLPIAHYLPARLAGGGRTVPVLRTPGGVVADSTAILRWADARLAPERRLFPEGPLGDEVARWEERFDHTLGPHARRWAYFHVLPDRARTEPMLVRLAPPVEAAAVRALYPVARRVLERGLNITPETAARSEKRLDELFDEVDAALSDGRRWLCGERFTAADVTLAALGAPVFAPPAYARWAYRIEELPAAMRAKVEAWRARPAGRLALAAYEKERDARP